MCQNPRDNNSAVNCTSSVPRGTIAQYRCNTGNNANASYEATTLSCICKGRWKGLPKYNEVATGCGATTISLSLANATTPLPTIAGMMTLKHRGSKSQKT